MLLFMKLCDSLSSVSCVCTSTALCGYDMTLVVVNEYNILEASKCYFNTFVKKGQRVEGKTIIHLYAKECN